MQCTLKFLLSIQFASDILNIETFNISIDTVLLSSNTDKKPNSILCERLIRSILANSYDVDNHFLSVCVCMCLFKWFEWLVELKIAENWKFSWWYKIWCNIPSNDYESMCISEGNFFLCWNIWLLLPLLTTIRSMLIFFVCGKEPNFCNVVENKWNHRRNSIYTLLVYVFSRRYSWVIIGNLIHFLTPFENKLNICSKFV